MKITRLAGLTLMISALSASSARAAPVMVGQLFAPDTACATDTFLQSGVSSGNSYTIPVAGVVSSWSFQFAGTTIPGLKLKIARPAGGSSYTIVGESVASTETANAVNTYPTSIPVQPGDIIGIYNPLNSGVCVSLAGKTSADIVPHVSTDAAPGSTMSYSTATGGRLPVSVSVSQPPGVSTISPSSGSISGGTSVTITGHDFSGATAVTFGGVAAESFTVNSDSSLSAVAPAAVSPGTVDVRVTTAAGMTPVVAGDKFTYIACVVPKLKHKKLKKAKKLLNAAHCVLGKVKGPKGKHAKVKKQTPKAGTILPSGGAVALKMMR